MTMRQTTTGPTLVEMYSGAGLFSYAFAREGFTVIDAVELDKTAASTYRLNLGDHIRIADVRKTAPAGTCDVLSAGVPCQSFSTLGKRDSQDPRNLLALEVIRWAKLLKPKIVVIENVPPFLKSPVWNKLTRTFRALGYQINYSVLNAMDYGVPQNRLRSFTFASRDKMPAPSQPRRRCLSTVRDAWQDLPSVPDGKNNHYSPRPSELALARMKVIPSGGDKRDIMNNAPQLAAPSWWRVQNEVTDVWGRMEWNLPSNTIRTALLNPSKGRYIHPEQHRVISLREAARLQSIPDNWVFLGTPYQIARQIGNGVPPKLGQVVAKAVYAAL
jgi:DNA (cytosine-5)-methyltransferase 1